MMLYLHLTHELVNIINEPVLKAITGYASSQVINARREMFKQCEIYAYGVNTYELTCRALHGIEFPPMKLYLTQNHLFISSASLTLHNYTEITVKLPKDVSAFEHFLANLTRIQEPVLTPML